MDFFLQVEWILKHLRQYPDDTIYVVAAVLPTLILLGAVVFAFRKYCVFVLKSLRRNVLRTTLTSLGVMLFVFQVTLIWSFLVVLDVVMTEKSRDLKAIVTERWKIPSQMPFAYASTLEDGAATQKGDIRPQHSMTWQFYGGTIDPTKRTRENSLFFFAMDPRKMRTMMDDLDNLDQALVDKMIANKAGALMGKEKLLAMNKRVGEKIKVTSMNFKDIDLEFEVVGELPDGRYNMNAIMNRDYLNDALDAYPGTHNGTKHPLADSSLNLVWLKVPDMPTFNQLVHQIEASSLYKSPAVKCETASSGIASWLEPYHDLLWGLKYLLVPATLAIMTMIMAISISISVRERRTEVAVLKVLGFSPLRILALILGEALLIGGGSGMLCGGLTYLIIHHLLHGIKFPVGFFPIFDVYADAIWWGLLFGSVTALLGSIVPAWSARQINVSEVFAKVT